MENATVIDKQNYSNVKFFENSMQEIKCLNHHTRPSKAQINQWVNDNKLHMLYYYKLLYVTSYKEYITPVFAHIYTIFNT